MKGIIICFITNKRFDEVLKLSSKYFHDFTVIDPGQGMSDELFEGSLPHFLLLPFNPGEQEQEDNLRKLITGKPEGRLSILLTDKSRPDNVLGNFQELFDMIVPTDRGLNSASKVVEALCKSHQLEQDFDNTEKKYKTLVNNLPGITYQCKNDSNWTMLRMSRKTEKLTGYPAKAFIKNREITYSDVIIPQDREKVWLSIQKALKNKVPFQIEYRIRTASGRTKWVWEKGRGIEHPEQGLLIEGVIMDIDSQKNLELRIKLMRELVIAMEATTDLNHLMEKTKEELGKVLNTFDIYLQLFDWEKREFLVPVVEHDREYYKNIPMAKTLDAMVIKRNRSLLLRKPDILKLERQGRIVLDNDPPEVWLGVPLKMKGKAAGIIALQDKTNPFALNETDIELLEFVSVQIVVSILKKQAEDETGNMLQAMDQSPLSVMITNLDGKVMYANRKSLDISGYTIKELYGNLPMIMNPYECEPDHHQDLWSSLESNGLWEGEYLNKNKAGKPYWESAMISSIKNSRNKTSHYLYVSEEITKRKKIENELKKAKSLAEESDKLKTAFLANMSHEIRTPMNAIIGFTDMLRNDEYSKQEHEEFLTLIGDNSKKLLNTIENIIDIAKIEAGELTITHTRCSANKILYDVFYSFEKKKHKLDKSHIKFTASQYKEDENLQFMSDPIRINQVLSNLIENAFKYTYEGEIELGYTLVREDDTTYIVYYVKDSGLGISRHQTDTIFNRFTQAGDNYMSTSGGTGLGLAISRNIARLMNGDIKLKSEVGKGSEFRFMIPFIPPKSIMPAPDTLHKIAGENYEYTSKTILIAEDEDSNYKLLEVMLRKTNVRIVRAYNGKQATDYVLGGNDADLILMDVRMPVMNGYEATEHIKKFDPTIPVIVQTAFALSGDRESSFEAGCDGYLSKPIIASELYKVMKKFLG